jgi:outer membrane protein assembly factor BamB
VPPLLRDLRPPPLRVWVWAASTLALVAVAALLWRSSDAAATESTTAPPADVPSGTAAGTVSEVWSASGGPLPASVVEGGRVLLGSAHGVRALDPATGEEAWHYTRSNAVLCGLTATDGVAVAVFRTEDRCDEAVALDAGTGVRAWTRNVRFRADVTLDATDGIVLASSPTGVVTLDPTGNTIRWRHAPPEGCVLLGADAGSAGVAVLQRCTGSDDVRLRLLDGFEGDAHWTRELPARDGAEIRLLGADGLLGVLVDGEVRLLSSADGTVLNRLPVSVGAADEVEQVTSGTVTLLLVAGTLSAFDATTAAPLWSTPAVGAPSRPETVEDPAGPAPLLVPETGGFVLRSAATGEELGRASVSEIPENGAATAVGATVVLRLPNRVLGFR